ncbi:MAG TPA: polysaccharide biosynthesis C-terminal domain-containing protein, partial [Bacteroidales bacterium]|nr:polysaccharide biosynthesis C-terminal domain-containing protein [Bacteroidales bacterium]
GLGITIIGSYILIPSLGITGACITTVAANVISSIIVIYKFYTNTSFSLSDFIITKSEITMLYSKILSKIHS